MVIKPFGFGVVRDGAFYTIVSVGDKYIELSKDHGYPWTSTRIAYTGKRKAIREAKFLASYFKVKYVKDHLYL